jgi:NADPH:quinone reductase-like Zn-dependent oxidoreductase
MKAAVIYEHGGPGSIRVENSYPDPVAAEDEVLLRVKAATMNYHDIFTRKGMPGIKVPMPCIMGIDFAGVIEKVGAGVSGWKPGDAVMVNPYDKKRGLMGEMRPGGFAELCAVRAELLIRMPEGMDFAAAAALPAAYGTAQRLLHSNGAIKAGERILILGASGGVGTGCVQLAKLAGCEVAVCASTDDKLERLKALGADVLINYKTQDFVEEVYRHYGRPHRSSMEKGVDVVVNFTGGDTWVPSLKTLHRQGRLITCGATAGFNPVEDIRYIWAKELRIIGSNGWTHEDLLTLMALVQKGLLKPVLHDKIVPLEDINEAFRLLEEREAFGKVLVRPDLNS